MITALIKKILNAIASMSQKASIVYCWILTTLFFTAIAILLSGVINLMPSHTPAYAITLSTVGGFLLLAVTFVIGLTTISSNYVKRKEKKEKKQSSEDESK